MRSRTAAALALFVAPTAAAQEAPFAPYDGNLPLIVAVDTADDDGDGIVDARDPEVAGDDPDTLAYTGPPALATVPTGLRLLRAGVPVRASRGTVRIASGDRIQATSEGAYDLAIGEHTYRVVAALVSGVPAASCPAVVDADGDSASLLAPRFGALGAPIEYARGDGPPTVHAGPVRLRSGLALVPDETAFDVALGDRLVIRPAGANGPVAARTVVGGRSARCESRVVPLRVHVVRGPVTRLPFGRDDAGAEAEAQAALARADSTLAACGIRTTMSHFAIVTPAPARLLGFGSPAERFAFSGTLTVAFEGRTLAVELPEDVSATQAGLMAAIAAREAGIGVRLAYLSRDADGSAAFAELLFDVPIRRVDGERLGVRVAALDLDDGIDAMRPATARTGSAESRALALPYLDADPDTLEVFFVERFADADRLGEAYVASDGGSLAGMMAVTRAGALGGAVTQTIEHELGHLLMDDAEHPPTTAAELPRRVMAGVAGARTGRGFTREECARMRTHPSLTPP